MKQNLKPESFKTPREIKTAWREAVKTRKRAYAPYSKFQVGAAILDKRGRLYRGCNVENASYGATICAERNAVLSAVADGALEIQDVVVVTEMNPPAEPCALCLQVLAEFSTDTTRVWLADLKGVREMVLFSELLPRHFGPRSLKRGLRQGGKV
ncbi:MAG: cytidine deaminase [Bdellovibrionales bacterium]|jgi:homotetrameric cytidine deaminase|nr:cytidine deaminase [Bdellovibrionales bacterium]